MRYGQGLLDEILRRTDIVQLVAKRVKLVRKGRVMWGCCPFHKEKSPSFKVENERRNYKCFGCGKGGDAFKWLMETEGLSFPEAVERLGAEAGVEVPKWTETDEAREQQKKSLYEIIEAACLFFEDQLRGPGGGTARDYLLARGLNAHAAKQFRIGYAPGGNGLKDHLTAKNVALDDLIAAGVVRAADGERGARDFFFDRIMFPITDPRGRVVAFGGRGLSPDSKPKYVNTGETSLFSKGHMLYNFAKARPVAIKEQNIIVAEGYMDVIALARAGFEAAVAPLGTALTEDQLHLLWRVAAEPVLAFDGDEAGQRAAHRAAHLALPYLKPGHSLRFAFLPVGEDPDSYLRTSGAAAMRKLIEEAEPLGRVLWREQTEGKDFSTPERRAGLERALAEITQTIGDTTIADYYRRDFENQVFDAFKRRQSAPKQARGAQMGQFGKGSKGRKGFDVRPGYGPGPAVSPEVKNSSIAKGGKTAPRRIKELELASLLWEQPALAARHGEILAALCFADPLLDRLRHELLNLAASGGSLETTTLETHLVRIGLTELAEYLARRASGEFSSATERDDSDRGHADAEEVEARWLRAARQLREIAELDPERARAMDRFRADASEENWRDVQLLLEQRATQGE